MNKLLTLASIAWLALAIALPWPYTWATVLTGLALCGWLAYEEGTKGGADYE